MFLDSIRKKLSSFQIIILGFLGVILMITTLKTHEYRYLTSPL